MKTNFYLERAFWLVGALGVSVMPTAIYGLFHLDSWAFAVSRFVFSLT